MSQKQNFAEYDGYLRWLLNISSGLNFSHLGAINLIKKYIVNMIQRKINMIIIHVYILIVREVRVWLIYNMYCAASKRLIILKCTTFVTLDYFCC